MSDEPARSEGQPTTGGSSSNPSNVVRLRELGALIRGKREVERLTLGQASQQSGVSAATLSRLERQQIKGDGHGGRGYHEPDVRTLAAITRWLGVAIDRVADVQSPPTAHRITHHANDTTPDIVRAHLRADPNLSESAAEALANLFRLTYEQFSGLKAPHIEAERVDDDHDDRA